jgi:riboflavin biosynthesis pyrimidine reductase
LSLDPLELLAEPDGLRSFSLPDELGRLYPGTIGFPDEWIYTNFVSTIDGVVSLQGIRDSNRLIADASEADRFVMALLRACADVVLIGAGTLRGSPQAVWTAESAYPKAAPAFAELRADLGLQEHPDLAIITSGKDFPLRHPIVDRDPIILTTSESGDRLRPLLPTARIIPVTDGDRVELPAAIDSLRWRGYGRILSEAGPHLFGSLLEEQLVDELFLTLSPLVAGRPSVAGTLLSMVEGVALLPETRVAWDLHGVRRHGEHLFLRYAATATQSPKRQTIVGESATNV